MKDNNKTATNYKVEGIKNNYAGNLGTAIKSILAQNEAKNETQYDTSDSLIGVESSAGNRFYIVGSYNASGNDNIDVTLDGKVIESYYVLKTKGSKFLVKIPQIFDKKMGEYHRRFNSSRVVYTADNPKNETTDKKIANKNDKNHTNGHINDKVNEASE